MERFGRLATGGEPRPGAGRPGEASFAADTWVSTPSGMKVIQEVEVGHQVHAWDFVEHRIVTRTVRRIHRRRRAAVRVDLGDWRLELTPDHRLWSASQHQWKRADQLKPREILGVGAWHWVWRFAPGLSRVSSVQTLPTTPVYSIDLHLSDNYLVGPDRVIVSDYLPAITSNPGQPGLP
jgi:hypothetical protein